MHLIKKVNAVALHIQQKQASMKCRSRDLDPDRRDKSLLKPPRHTRRISRRGGDVLIRAQHGVLRAGWDCDIRMQEIEGIVIPGASVSIALFT